MNLKAFLLHKRACVGGPRLSVGSDPTVSDTYQCNLVKQVQEVREVNSDLETRVSQLTSSNEKLLDSEGQWYSLARELENQMDVIKKVTSRRCDVVCFRD